MVVDANIFMSVRQFAVTSALFVGNSVTLQRYSDESSPSCFICHPQLKDVHIPSVTLVCCTYVVFF
jgi:hypothetical protein